MTTLQSQKDRPKSVSSNSTPTSPVPRVGLNLDNSAFFSEPTFQERPSSPTPSPTTSKEPETKATSAKTDVAPSPTPPTSTAAKHAITAIVDAPMTLAQTSATPVSPVASSAQPMVVMSVDTTVMEDVDSDAEMSEDKDGLASPVSPVESFGILPKENGVQFTERNRVEELEILNANLQANLDETLVDKLSLDSELNRTRGAYHDLHRQYMDLQQKLEKRERDYEVMSKNYLEHVRLIRATDDDHGTIMDRLTQLKASIEHLIRKAQGGRSVNLNKETAVEHFKQSGLLKDFPVPEDKLESYHLNLYMESVVMSTLASSFFDKPLSCIFEYNKGFKEIYDWMLARNDKLAVRWRQQLCKMLADDPGTKARQEQEVTRTAEELSGLVSKIYANANELTKIKDICNKAFELAIAMTGLESLISPANVPLGTVFDEETMGTSLKSNPEGKVALVIFPAFKDKENAFDVRPKVWCY